jgi:hypothetical protein
MLHHSHGRAAKDDALRDSEREFLTVVRLFDYGDIKLYAAVSSLSRPKGSGTH